MKKNTYKVVGNAFFICRDRTFYTDIQCIKSVDLPRPETYRLGENQFITPGINFLRMVDSMAFDDVTSTIVIDDVYVNERKSNLALVIIDKESDNYCVYGGQGFPVDMDTFYKICKNEEVDITVRYHKIEKN